MLAVTLVVVLGSVVIAVLAFEQLPNNKGSTQDGSWLLHWQTTALQILNLASMRSISWRPRVGEYRYSRRLGSFLWLLMGLDFVFAIIGLILYTSASVRWAQIFSSGASVLAALIMVILELFVLQ